MNMNRNTTEAGTAAGRKGGGTTSVPPEDKARHRILIVDEDPMMRRLAQPAGTGGAAAPPEKTALSTAPGAVASTVPVDEVALQKRVKKTGQTIASPHPTQTLHIKPSLLRRFDVPPTAVLPTSDFFFLVGPMVRGPVVP
jgi:hypothetical protein